MSVVFTNIKEKSETKQKVNLYHHHRVSSNLRDEHLTVIAHDLGIELPLDAAMLAVIVEFLAA